MSRFANVIFIGALAVAILGAAAKVLILGLIIIIVAGLLFRTAQTVGLFVIGGLIALFQSYPLIAVGVCVVTVCAVMVSREDKAAAVTQDRPRLPAPE